MVEMWSGKVAVLSNASYLTHAYLVSPFFRCRLAIFFVGEFVLFFVGYQVYHTFGWRVFTKIGADPNKRSTPS